MATAKSAINEVRDQLFLDRAEGEFLSYVTENIGLDRPLFGFANDTMWRAIVRRLALDYKQVVPVFHDLLTIIFGPQTTQATVLLTSVAAGDESLFVADNGEEIPQRGTLVLDEGLAAEETVEYTFRDPRTGEVELSTALTQAHTALETSGQSFLASDAVASDTTITVEDAVEFPDPAVVGDYPIIIDAGKIGVRSDLNGTFAFSGSTVTFTASAALFTADLVGKYIRIAGATTVGNDGTFRIASFIDTSNVTWENASGAAEAFSGLWTVLGLDVEEVVICTTKTGNVLTLTAGLINDHAGPVAGMTTTPLTAVGVGKALIFGTDVDEFPGEGLLQVQEDAGTPSEFVRYEDKSNADLSFQLKAPLAGTFSTAMITLAAEGATVQLAQVQVKGVNWDVVETEPNLLRIILPISLDRNRLRDASYLHDSGTEPSTAVASGGDAVVDDTVLEVTDASAFPDAGIIRIDAAGTPEDVSYYRIDRLSAVLYDGINSAPHVGIGDSISGTAPSMTLNDAAGLFVASDIGRTLVLNGWSISNNDGRFKITARTATTANYQNASGAAETFAGYWSISGPTLGDTELAVSNVLPFVVGAALGVGTAVIDRTGTPEEVTILSIDVARNVLTLASALTASHGQGDTIEVGNLDSGVLARGPNSLHLMSPLTADHAAAQTVDLLRVFLTGDLEDGRIFTADAHRFQGPFTWDPTDKIPRVSAGASPSSTPIETTLAEDIAGPQDLEVGQRASRTALEVRDASAFVGPPNDYQQVQVGRGLGGRETRSITDIVLQRDVVGLTLVGGLITAPETSFDVSGVGLPNAWGYRLFLDDDGTGVAEEIVIVKSVSGTTVTLETPTQNNHNADSVYLLADVLVVGDLAYDHEGLIAAGQNQRLLPGIFGEDWVGSNLPAAPSARVAKIEEVRAYIDVTDASDFPTAGGTVLLNTGKSQLGVESRLSDPKGAVTPGAGPGFTLAGSNVTLDDAGAFAAADVGRIIKVKNAITPGNDGTFIIASVSAGVSCTYVNAAGKTESFQTSPQTTYEVSGMAVGAATATVEDGSDFPTANFFVVVGRDTRVEEVLEVLSRTGNVLTFAAGVSGDPTFLHADGEWFEYVTGEIEELSYASIETGGANERLVFNEELGHYFEGPHVSGEGVNLSTQQATPSTDGNDYPFYLPSTWADRLQYVFDLARAAGVQIVVSSDQ